MSINYEGRKIGFCSWWLLKIYRHFKPTRLYSSKGTPTCTCNCTNVHPNTSTSNQSNHTFICIPITFICVGENQTSKWSIQVYSLMRFTLVFYLWFVIASAWTSILRYNYWASLSEPHTNRTALCMVCVYACLLTTNFKWAHFNMSTCTLAQSRTRDYCAVSAWKRPGVKMTQVEFISTTEHDR